MHKHEEPKFCLKLLLPPLDRNEWNSTASNWQTFRNRTQRFLIKPDTIVASTEMHHKSWRSRHRKRVKLRKAPNLSKFVWIPPRPEDLKLALRLQHFKTCHSFCQASKATRCWNLGSAEHVASFPFFGISIKCVMDITGIGHLAELFLKHSAVKLLNVLCDDARKQDWSWLDWESRSEAASLKSLCD